MADLLAADALDLLMALVSIRILCVIILLIIVRRLVLAGHAPRSLLAEAAAAPPHALGVDLEQMNSAAPLEVVFFVVLLSTALAGLYARVELAFTRDEL